MKHGRKAPGYLSQKGNSLYALAVAELRHVSHLSRAALGANNDRTRKEISYMEGVAQFINNVNVFVASLDRTKHCARCVMEATVILGTVESANSLPSYAGHALFVVSSKHNADDDATFMPKMPDRANFEEN